MAKNTMSAYIHAIAEAIPNPVTELNKLDLIERMTLFSENVDNNTMV